jgi:urate oxidase
LVNIDGRRPHRTAYVVSGVHGLVVAKTTGSEFHGFLRDGYTTLQDTTDRVLATSLRARWRYDHTEVEWDASYAAIKAILLQEFARIHSLALQQTLYGMGKAVLEEHPEVAEIRLSAPNKHHLLVDLSPFGDDNPGEVFIATDRPYGLIEATVERDDASDPGSAWLGVAGFC